MKFLIDDKHAFRTVDEVYTFVATRMAVTKSIKIVLTEKDQSIENAMISPKILKLMKMTKDHCKVPEVVVDFKFEGVEEDTFSIVLRTDAPVSEVTVAAPKKESLISKLNVFKSKNSDSKKDD